ncbi:MAG: hypothetical protein H0V82_12235 [Candidatus Protochlamydia sp.]|nr:hypothetical protein [Candidatus Protochlamydia sp.]
MFVTQTVFFEKPQVLYVDEDYSVKPPAYGTIEKLMKSLQENGPLVAIGKMGPSAYSETPFKLKDKLSNEEVYGWRPLTSKEHAASTQVILLGAKQTESNAYVYFTLAKDITKNESSLIRGYKPLDTDAKVYVMSYENFLKRSLVDLHPICPHGRWLFSQPVNSLLDGGEIEKKCNQIGQQIFDHYKIVANGSSEAGRSAVVRICEAAKVLTHDGLVRKAHIEHAWDGIGDMTWQWRS